MVEFLRLIRSSIGGDMIGEGMIGWSVRECLSLRVFLLLRLR